MFTDADESLGELENGMLKVARAVLDELQDMPEGKPIPIQSMMFVEKVHKAILSRLGKRTGLDMAMIMKNPRAALVQHDRMRAMIVKIIDQQESAKLKVVSNG